MGGVDISQETQRIVATLKRDNPELSLSSYVKAAWEEVLGDASGHVVSVFVVPHTQAREVVVYVDSAIYAAEFTMQSELLRMKLNVKLASMVGAKTAGGEPMEIEDLKFVVSSERYSSRHNEETYGDDVIELREYEMSIQPQELDDGELDDIMQALSGIEDDQLREAAYDAAKANLEWQKGIAQATQASSAL